MGLFGKMFEKKTCDICGGEIGLLGNKKLEDGNMCKDCVKKLSPWFSERRHSTVESIKEQLAYRAANEPKVAAFHVDQIYGNYEKLYLDRAKKQFFVTSSNKWQEANPDVIDIADLTAVETDISSTKREVKVKNAEGKEVSCNPPRYKYLYMFKVTLRINNPYFDEISFQLNSTSVEEEQVEQVIPVGGRLGRQMGTQTMGVQSGSTIYQGLHSQKYRDYEAQLENIRNALEELRHPQAFTEVSTASFAPAAGTPDAAPSVKTVCPYCDSVMEPTADGCCSVCGAKL